MVQKYDYVIIGAGLSGLNTAYQILKKNKKCKICLIEKYNEIGGRIHSVYLHNNLKYEAGAIRFYPEHKNLLSLMKEFGLNSKNFITVPNDYPRNNLFTKKSLNLKIKEKTLNKELLETKNINKFLSENMSLEDYALKVIGKSKLDYLKTINGFQHIFKTSAVYGLYLLKRDFVDVKEFYILKGSLTEFLYKILDNIQDNGCKLLTGEEFLSFKNLKNNDIEVKTSKNTYKTNNLILAIPYSNLNKIKKIPNELVNSVMPIPLCRIFSIYPNNNYWHNNLKSTFSNNNIQRIFPTGTRLIQISYTSGDKADFWGKLSKDKIKLKQELHKELMELFPKKKIDNPDLLNVHYWSEGIHLWNKDIESDSITDKIIKPLDDTNLYICNEAYSKYQRWMEGSVEMSNRVVNLIFDK
tara:strand:+ start:101 stop:1333 length:1233 start_codon:yes stop_codon:yes gene_type:complete